MMLLLSSSFKLKTTVSVAFAVAYSLLIVYAGADDAVDRSGKLRDSHNLLGGRELQWQQPPPTPPTWQQPPPVNPHSWQPPVPPATAEPTPAPVPAATAEPTPAPVAAATAEPTPAPVPPATAEPTPAPVPAATPEPNVGGNDCSTDFCETTLTDGYLLRYKLNEPDSLDGTISMELVYDGVAWVGIAFSEDEKMGGSNGIM